MLSPWAIYPANPLWFALWQVGFPKTKGAENVGQSLLVEQVGKEDGLLAENFEVRARCRLEWCTSGNGSWDGDAMVASCFSCSSVH